MHSPVVPWDIYYSLADQTHRVSHPASPGMIKGKRGGESGQRD